jgi:hypothetical protein
MALMSVSDFSFLINQQTQAQERVEACLWKLEAMLAIAVTTKEFFRLSETTLHNYFSAASDLIEQATEANQVSLTELLRQRR